MLGINPKHYAFNVYQLSINELKKVNSVKSPINKCKVVIESINVLSSLFTDKLPGSDEIFPILLYCILSTNPPYLHSNVSYMRRYLSPAKQRDKEGFILTTLNAAVNFLENIDGSYLSEGEIRLSRNPKNRSHLF